MICSQAGSLAETLWNPTAELVCVRCESRFAIDAGLYDGCPACGRRSPLVVAYRGAVEPEGELPARITAVARARLPIHPERVVQLGQGGTPLVALPRAEKPLLLKVEGQNPTGSHKDRFHAIAEAIAAGLGFRSVVASSTGNHGLACAAYAAAAGLRALILLDPDAPAALATQLAMHEATIAVIPDDVGMTVARLVDDEGWYPSTSADPTLAGRANPYGAEGYKAIAYEIVADLGRVPDVVAVPAASGDTFYGVWRGFTDLHEVLGLPMPMLLACQPAGAAPLALTAGCGSDEPCEVEDATSLALSARDARSGWHATVALRHGGEVVTVSEARLRATLADLGRRGFGVEPASALSVSALTSARDTGLVDPAATAVALLTSSNANWTEHLASAFGAPTIANSPEAVLDA
jgi:threonine synthase